MTDSSLPGRTHRDSAAVILSTLFFSISATDSRGRHFHLPPPSQQRFPSNQRPLDLLGGSVQPRLWQQIMRRHFWLTASVQGPGRPVRRLARHSKHRRILFFFERRPLTGRDLQDGPACDEGAVRR